MKRGLALFLAALLTALALTACGGGGGYSGGSDSGAPAASESQTAYDSGGGDDWKAAVQEFGFDAPAGGAGEPAGPGAAPDGGETQAEDRLASAKIVYTADIQAETQDFDACTAALEDLVDGLGGYLEYASAGSGGDGSRSASYTVRVPAKEFRGFLKTVGEISHVTSQSRNADNISERYYDTESRLGNAFTDGLRSFGDFLQGLAIFLAYNWIWLLFLGLVLLVVVKLSKRRQIQRTAAFREARERGNGFFNRKKDGPKNPDDKQP